MKFSTRTTYGLRAMVKLSIAYGEGNVSLASISRDEHISLKYLERIFASLKKAMLIKSEKGVNGGYSLISDPENITVFDIVQALEGDMKLFHCMSENGKVTCSSKCNCGATKVLITIQGAINNTLKNMKLKSLL